MMLKSLGWLLVFLLGGFVFFGIAAMAWENGVVWGLGWLGVVWGVFLLADLMRWRPLRDAAWVAGASYGLGVIRWLDVPADALPYTLRLLVMGGYALCLAFFAFVAPGLLGWVAQRLRPAAEPGLPVEKPPSPEMLRRWDPKD